jgi:hypothetical protein
MRCEAPSVRYKHAPSEEMKTENIHHMILCAHEVYIARLYNKVLYFRGIFVIKRGFVL